VRDTLALYGGEKTTHQQFPAWPQFAERTFTDILEPLRSGRVASWSGQKVAELESHWAAWAGVRHAVACSSGTAALHMSLRALGIGPGDEVIVPARTFASTALAVVHAGARPVFCDVGDDQVIDPRSAEERVTGRTRALLIVHLFGIVCPMDRITDLARRHSLFIIEDCAQCTGGEFSGRMAGSLGNAGCFSFSQGKHICAGGEGGMVTTDDPGVAAACRALRDYGRDPEAAESAGDGRVEGRAHVQAGFNYRMTEMQAIVALNELDRLELWNLARRAGFAKVYDHALSHVPGVRALPLNTEERRNAWWKYPLQLNLADLTCDCAEFSRALVAEGVPDGGAHWPEAYTEPVFAAEQHPACPNARAVRERTVALLLPPTWEKQHVETCASAVRKLLHAYKR
jgi:dTDP-4-amino-4,6-dideoxygalactose transaminase